jgi:hypothetical protein
MEKNLINAGHYLELMDRTYIMMENINDHLIQHPLTDNEEDIKVLFEEASDILFQAYQLIGSKSIDYETKINGN